MIKELTSDQVAKFPDIVKKWTDIGLCTEPANRQTAERAIRLMYQQASLKEPHIVWCESPMSQALTRGIINLQSNVWNSVAASVRDSVMASVGNSVRDSVEASVRASVGNSVRASVGNSVSASIRNSVRADIWGSVRVSIRDSVEDSVWDSVRDIVRADVWNSVWDSVGASIKGNVGNSVRDNVRDSVSASIRDSVSASIRDSVWDSVKNSGWNSVWDSVAASVRDSIYGQHEAAWLSFYDYFNNVCNLKRLTEPLSNMMLLAKSAGWVLPHEHICWVSERHNILHRDDRGLLHCENGPALAYPDGWSIYAWHGTHIPKSWITNKSQLTAEMALTCENVEQRRAACEILGWESILQLLNASVIDADSDPQIGTLVEVSIPGIGRERFLRVTCGTGRKFALPVPSNMRTAIEANAWTWNLTPEKYNPEIRT